MKQTIDKMYQYYRHTSHLICGSELYSSDGSILSFELEDDNGNTISIAISEDGCSIVIC